MNYIRNTIKFHSKVPSAITLGKFDGLHRGHQKLIRTILQLQKEGLSGIVFTIAPEQIPVLLTPEEKKERLQAEGIDTLIDCPFVPEILGMEPEQFVADVLVKQLQVRHIVVGTDFHFGHNRKGDAAFLGALQEKYGYRLSVIEKECLGSREISSTYVREALKDADLELVNRLLGYEYSVKGTVVHGKQLGRQLGMPTVNLLPSPRKLLPPRGVYYSRLITKEKTFCGVSNIGFKPTVDGAVLGAETYAYGLNEELYGQQAEAALLKFRRPERRFDSVGLLKEQMESDILAGKEFFHVE